MTKQKTHNKVPSEADNRARSVTVGTSFGGTTELIMRRGDGNFTFAIMQPVEVIELIHQLSANVGCHLHLQPRRDFSSWRDWKYTEEELAHYRGQQHLPGMGHPPHANDMALHMQVGANLPSPEQQAGLTAQGAQEKENVATKKAVNKRTTKRSRTSTK